MNLDDILELAAARTPSPLEQARNRRDRREILREFERSRAENRSAVGDHDVSDPIAAAVDEVTRITRVAQAAKAGTLVWYAESGQLLWSEEMSTAFGYPPGAVAVSPKLVTDAIHPDDRARAGRLVHKAWQDVAPAEFTVRIRRADGVWRYLSCLVEVLTESDFRRRGVIATARDVTSEAREHHEQALLLRRQKIGHAAPVRRVPGTGLLQRQPFLDEIDIHAQGGQGGLLSLSVEFASQPKTGTQAQAETLTRTMGAVLERYAETPDSCGLLGPDEYGVLLRDLGADDARRKADSIVLCLSDRLAYASPSGTRLRVWGGLVTFARSPAARGQDLLQDARSARQSSHADGVPLKVLSTPRDSHTREVMHRGKLLEDLASDQLRLYSQKILDVTLNEVTRHEILLRVLDERGRPQPPAPFLEIAEHISETLAVDAWVIDHALAIIGQGPQTSHYQINLSARSLSRSGLIERISRAIGAHGIDPAILTFEVTESVAVDNLTAAIRFADDLTRLGCRLAVDDFGTGPASLRLLKYLPVDLVKIDGDFIGGLRESPFNQVAVRSALQLCADLGIRTAAEHVPDQETLDLLRQYGVDFAQGHAIAEPLPIVHGEVVPLDTAGLTPRALLGRAAG